MAMQNHVRNPLEWGWDHLKQTSQAVGSTANSMDGAWEDRAAAPPRSAASAPPTWAMPLRRASAISAPARTDVVMLCLLYPLAGLDDLAHGLRLRDAGAGLPADRGLRPDRAAVRRSASTRSAAGASAASKRAGPTLSPSRARPNIGSIMVMGLLLLAIFCLWLFAANLLYTVTLGPDAPVSAAGLRRAMR